MRKIGCLFLSILLICSCFSISVYSFYSENVLVYGVETVYSECYATEKTELEKFTDTSYVNLYQYNFDNKGYIYTAYSQLPEIEKMIYNKFVSALMNGNISVQIDFNPILSKEDYQKIDWKRVLEGIRLDHPEFFYLYSMSIGYAAYPDGRVVYIILTAKGERTKSDNTRITVYTDNQMLSCTTELTDTVKNIDLDLSNRYSFVKNLHDYLCNNIVYIDNDFRCHDAYGALVEGVAVCQGYAEAFKLICDYYKIPCVCLTGDAGGPHMWNAVQMDDGKWYLMDVTWDDQSHRIYDDFFLIGLNTKDTYFGGNAFNVSHISDGSPYLPILNYATDKYSETNHNTAFKATYNALAIDEGNFLIRSCFDIEDTNVYYNGMYVETNNLTTNGIFEVPSGQNGNLEKWTLVLLGDCNGDGYCNVSDYSDAVNKVLADNEISNASDMAADMDCDGCLDVIDLAIMHLATSGLNTDIEIE